MFFLLLICSLNPMNQVKTKLKKGVEKTIEYYNEYGIEQTYTHLNQGK